MSGSNLTPFTYIAENSLATPGLWNSIFSTLSQNIAEANTPSSILSGGISLSTRGLTINVPSNSTDYIFLNDSANLRSSYVIGSFNTGTADGLNIFDASGQTMIVSFSKQSVRFFQQVVGPVFDVGGALADTLNAATFGSGSDSTESRIQAAINDAALAGISRVYVPANMYPYSASSVSFIYTVQMVREGGNWTTYDPIAYGAVGNGVHNDGTALRECASSASGTGISVYLNGVFAHSSSSITFNSDIFGTGTIKLLAGSPSGTACATLEGAEHTIQGVKFDATAQAASIGLRLWNTQRCKILSSQFTGARRGALKIGSRAIDTTVIGNTFNNPGYGILYDDAAGGSNDSLSRGIVIAGNSFLGDGGASGTNGDAIEINAPTSGFTRIVISGNHIKDYYANDTTAGIGIGLSGVGNVIISDNVVNGCTHEGIHVEEGLSGWGPSYDVLIRNNSVYSCGGLLSTPEVGIGVNYTRSAAVIGNHVRLSGSAGIKINAIAASFVGSMDSVGIIVANNVCEENGTHGIINIAYPNALIMGNTLVNNSKQTKNNAMGISLNTSGGQSPTDNLIIGNVSYGTWHQWGLDVNVATRTRVVLNSFFTAGTAPYRDLGTASEFVFNHVTSTPSLETVTNPTSFASNVSFKNRVSIGNPLITPAPALSVVGQVIQEIWSDTAASNTSRTVRLGALAHDDSQVPVAAIIYQVNPGGNTLSFGGGSGSLTAATAIRFLTSTTTTATTGTEAARITSTGSFGVGIITPRTGILIDLAGSTSVGTGSAINPGLAFGSDVSLGLYKSAASTIALSYGTVDLTAGVASLSSLYIKSGTNNSCGTAVLGSNGSVNVANTYVKTGDLIFLTDQTPGGTLGDLEILGIRNSSGFTIASTSITDTSTVAWLIVRPN